MTREQIRDKILKILDYEVEADDVYESLEKAADKIMELWDQGLVYETVSTVD